MNPFLENVLSIASKDKISKTKVFISELQKVFLEEFYGMTSSQGWVLIGGANLKFIYGQKRHTKDVDFGCTGNVFENVHETLEFMKFLESRLEKRIGFSVAIKIDENKTLSKIFVRCEELGGQLSFDVEFTSFPILSAPEKAKIGQVLVLGSSLKEMKISKILSLLLRPQVEPRDLFDIFINPEPVDLPLLNQYLKQFKKKMTDLKRTVSWIEENMREVNSSLMEELKEDIGVVETEKYVSNVRDTALVQRVLREIRGIYA